MNSEYCYVEDQAALGENYEGLRYAVRTDAEGFVLARFQTYNFATWFKDAVNSAYQLATQMDHD